MMHAMRPDDAAEDPKTQQEAHREARVAEPVVHDEVADAKAAHSHACPKGELAREGRLRDAAEDDEPDRERRVQQRERVVRLEPRAVARCARRVVRPMDRPQPTVPDLAVQERRPQVHQDRDDERDGRPHERVRERSAHDAPPAWRGGA